MNARSIAAYALALAFVAGSGRVALAQDRGQRGQRPDSSRARRDPPVPVDPNTAIKQAEQARQAEEDRQAAQRNPQAVQGRPTEGQNRSNNNGQDRSNNNGQDRNYNGQDRGQDRNYSGQDRGYNGQDRRFGQNDRGFTDRDRQATRQWYQQHRRRLGPGWRSQDRLSPSLQARLRRGQRLDPMLRQRMYWLPPDLALMYGPAPRGYRYAIIGGNIVLLDDMYEVHDIFTLDFNF